MVEISDANYTIGVTFLLVTTILKKIKLEEGIESDEITPELINKYLPEIEKHLPDIKKQLPQLVKYIRNNKKIMLAVSEDDNYDKINNILKTFGEPEKSKFDDFSTSNCVPIKHKPYQSCKNECFSDKYYKVCEIKPVNYNDLQCRYYDSELCKKNHCDDKHPCDNKCHCDKKSDDNDCQDDKTSEIDEHIKKIKCRLDKLTESEKEHLDSDDSDDDRTFIEHIDKTECREISDEEEKTASQWDLCELRRDCKPCKHECGDFAIDEDLDIFKNKVIKKAEVIISCYKKKLMECEQTNCHLQKSLHHCIEKNKVLECKLEECHKSLKCCEEDRKKLICRAKKYEKELACLIEKYCKLDAVYKHKKKEAERCHYKNKKLLVELRNLKHQLEECLCEKKKLKEEVEKLYCQLQLCRKDKNQLLKNICKLQEKLKRCENENTKLQCLVRQLKEEIHKLNKKVSLLICQNRELRKENADLKKQLGKILGTLKCLCDRYNALKYQCDPKYKY